MTGQLDQLSARDRALLMLAALTVVAATVVIIVVALVARVALVQVLASLATVTAPGAVAVGRVSGANTPTPAPEETT